MPTPLGVILSIPHEGRTIFTYRGKETLPTAQDIPLGKVHTSWLYVTSLGGNMTVLEHLLHQCEHRRIPVAINPGAQELRHWSRLQRVMMNVAVVLLNREEANLLLGGGSRTTVQALRALARVLRGVVVITDGSRGAAAKAGTTLYTSPAHLTKRAVERTGAGDAFGSGFVVGLLRSAGDPVIGLQYGTANAEAVIQQIGAKNGLLTADPPLARRVPVRSKRL